jgi:hypothetical protein
MLKVLDSAVPIACWSCSIGHNDSTLFCPHCSKIQPPPGGDYFSGLRFGAAAQPVDLAALEHEFHRLSRKVHPDRFARAGENERQWSLADTALLNDAYRTLKDPCTAPNTCSSWKARRLAKNIAARIAKTLRGFPPICSKRSST